MSSLSVSNTFVSLTTILASQVNTNFSDIVSYINNRNSASSAWDQLSVAGNAAIVGTLTNTGPINIGASSGTSFSVNSTDLKVDSTNHRVGIGISPTFTLDVAGTAITARVRSTIGATTLDLGTGSNGGTNDIKIQLDNGIGSLWAFGSDESASSAFKISNGASLGTNDFFIMKTTGDTAIHGTTTNDDAAAGFVGEYISSTSSSLADMASSTTWQNKVNISLTAGDWDVIGSTIFNTSTATLTDGFGTAISINSGNTTTDHVLGNNVLYTPTTQLTHTASATVHYRITVASGTTTVYLKTQATYSGGGPPQALGTIKARRVR